MINEFRITAIFLAICVHVWQMSALEQVSRRCLWCIYETLGGHQNVECKSHDGSEICGPFHINYNYWVDAGKIVSDDNSPFYVGARQQCLKNYLCSSRVVEGYINKFAKDCNEDGVINCVDHLLLHHLGKDSCVGGVVDPKVKIAFEHCNRTLPLMKLPGFQWG